VNGFRVPVDDPARLHAALRRLVDDAQLRSAAATHSRELAADFTPQRWAAVVANVARMTGRGFGTIVPWS
jgi:hypothetical protein